MPTDPTFARLQQEKAHRDAALAAELRSKEARKKLITEGPIFDFPEGWEAQAEEGHNGHMALHTMETPNGSLYLTSQQYEMMTKAANRAGGAFQGLQQASDLAVGHMQHAIKVGIAATQMDAIDLGNDPKDMEHMAQLEEALRGIVERSWPDVVDKRFVMLDQYDQFYLSGFGWVTAIDVWTEDSERTGQKFVGIEWQLDGEPDVGIIMRNASEHALVLEGHGVGKPPEPLVPQQKRRAVKAERGVLDGDE